MPAIKLKILNRVGLHARPADLFVKETKKYIANITITGPDGSQVNGKSILGVLSLGAEAGSELIVNAEGDDAENALAALQRLCENKFGEQE